LEIQRALFKLTGAYWFQNHNPKPKSASSELGNELQVLVASTRGQHVMYSRARKQGTAERDYMVDMIVHHTKHCGVVKRPDK
jgi:hypothetical protein